MFWVVVALPILVLWALRAPLPDLGYDTLNYHLMHGQKAWLGPLFPPGDFYPYFFPFLNPAGDMVNALFRIGLGYRGGTVASALALVWTGEVLWRLLAPVLKGERARAAAVLAAIATEGTLWEVSGYMVDLLPLPILLEALTLALSPLPEAGKLRRRSAVLGLLLGAAVALKLTNLVFALPVGLVALLRWRSGFRSIRPAIAALGAGAVAVVLPVARSVGAAAKAPEGVTATVLFETSAEGWGETNLADLETRVEKDEKDVAGPVPLAVAAEGSGKRKPRLVVLGDADFASNGGISNAANLYLVTSAANWLLERESLISIPPKSTEQVSVTLSRGDVARITFFVLLILPLAAIGLGIAVWLKRRR